MSRPKYFTGPVDKLSMSGIKGKEKLEEKIQELMDFVHMYANRNGMEELDISIKAGLMKEVRATVTFKIDDDLA